MFRNKKLSPGAFNLILGGITLYGLAANLLTAILAAPILSAMDPVALCIGVVVCTIAGAIISLRRKLWTRILAFHLIVLPFGPVLAAVLGSYSGSQVLLAIALTAIITIVMIFLSCRFPHIFSGLGGALLTSLLLALVVSILCWFLNVHLAILSAIFVGIFSLYIGYDWYTAQTREKTLGNAIEAGLDLYLDIINIFLDLLDLIDLFD